MNYLGFAISLFLCSIPSEITVFEKMDDICSFFANFITLPLGGDSALSWCYLLTGLFALLL